MSKLMEELIAEERAEEREEAYFENALKMLERGRVQEYELADFYGFTPQQVAQVLALYHQKAAVHA